MKKTLCCWWAMTAILLTCTITVKAQLIDPTHLHFCSCGFPEFHMERGELFVWWIDEWGQVRTYVEEGMIYTTLLFNVRYIVDDPFTLSPCAYGDVLAWNTTITGFRTFWGDRGLTATENLGAEYQLGVGDPPYTTFYLQCRGL
jgi:hypothetical protein